MARKTETPFNKILMTRSRLGMFVRYGEHALDGKTFQEFAAEVNEAMGYLMDFRNIVAGMVQFDETPQQSIEYYLETRTADADAA